MKARILTKTAHAAVFFFLALAVVFPLLKGPYLFLLDSVPKLNDRGLEKIIYGREAPVYGGWVLNTLSFILPPQHYQAMLIFLLLFMSSLCMYSLAFSLCKSRTASFYAGLLYAINPYTYIRIIVGHIVLAYAFIPLALKFFIEILEKKNRNSILKFALALSIVATNSHMLFISLLVLFIVFLLNLWKNKNFAILKPLAFSALIFCGCNFYWLVPAVLKAKETLLPNISQQDLLAFAPSIDAFTALFTLASMHGFWRPAYLYAKDFLPFWELLFTFILFLAVHGFVSYHNHKKLGIYANAFAVIWVAGLILAAGIRSPFADFFKFLFDHLFLLKGMRDTHKFVTMLCLSYSCLGALGLAKIEKSLKTKKPKIKKLAIFAILLIPLIYSFTFFNSFAGQIKPADFPNDWYEVNEFLNRDKDDFRVLFFPWHLYMDFHWVPNKDKRIANPAQGFFDKEVISAKNIEMPGIYRQVYSPYQVYVDHLLSRKNEITNFGELVSVMGVKYILLAKEADYKNYFFLFNQSDLELVLETENFYVFKNNAFKGLIFSVDGVAYAKDWDELINISRSEDITRRLYLIGVSYEKISPVKYLITEKTLKYVIFTEEYSKEWRLNGKQPLKAYGVVNAYAAEISLPMKITYDRFYRVCLSSYIVSSATFLVCALLLLRKRKR